MRPPRPLLTFAVLTTLAALLGLHPAPASASGRAALQEDFESLPQGTSWADGTGHGAWEAVYNGYGSLGIAVDGSQVLFQSPKASTTPRETHASLVTSGASFGDLDLTVRMRTVGQLRTPTPNPWEVAWLIWHYTDDTHFYYLAPKPNGWELGKEDPAYPGAQRYLVTKSSPTFPVGEWYTVRVRQRGSAITVWVNGAKLGSYTDTERPYPSGAIGLYNEDAAVSFDDISVTVI